MNLINYIQNNLGDEIKDIKDFVKAHKKVTIGVLTVMFSVAIIDEIRYHRKSKTINLTELNNIDFEEEEEEEEEEKSIKESIKEICVDTLKGAIFIAITSLIIKRILKEDIIDDIINNNDNNDNNNDDNIFDEVRSKLRIRPYRQKFNNIKIS